VLHDCAFVIALPVLVKVIVQVSPPPGCVDSSSLPLQVPT
jgi:hypothetical protein